MRANSLPPDERRIYEIGVQLEPAAFGRRDIRSQRVSRASGRDLARRAEAFK